MDWPTACVIIAPMFLLAVIFIAEAWGSKK